MLLVCDLYLSVLVVKCWNLSCLCDFSDCMCPQLFCRSFCDHWNCVLSPSHFSLLFSLLFFFFFLSQLDKRWGKNTMWKCIKNKYKSLLKKSAFDLIVVCESLQVNTCRMIYMVSVLKLRMPQIQKKKRTKQKEH